MTAIAARLGSSRDMSADAGQVRSGDRAGVSYERDRIVDVALPLVRLKR